MLGALLHSQARPVYKKQQLSQTDVSVLMGYYTQSGDHSAITGGMGTEQLVVFEPQVAIEHTFDSLNKASFSGGVDVVSSASADNIDFIPSSASRLDNRTHLAAGYERRLKHRPTSFGINAGYSLESAYQSVPVGISFSHTAHDGATAISAALQCYFDDLRWGRLTMDYGRPVELVYPAELRYRKWFDNYLRQSYNLSGSFSQIINKRLRVALFPEIDYQQGLLCTPYHRVYFKDGDERVETLPGKRFKLSIGTQAAYFAGSRTILRGSYRFYADDFGIIANSVQVQAALKLSPLISITPQFRFHTQSASRYFAAYGAHDPSERFFTSDYDLSALQSYEPGIAFRYAPQLPLARKLFFRELEARYSFYRRSDGLAAHLLSLNISLRRKSE